MSAAGSNVVRLTTNSAVDDEPTWSPRRQEHRFPEHPGRGHAHLADERGWQRGKALTTTGSNSDPVFSPSGQNLAFDSNRSGNTDIYSVNVDGSAQTRLTTVSALDNQPSWQALLAMAVRRGYPPGRAGAARVFGREESVQRLAKGTL